MNPPVDLLLDRYDRLGWSLVVIPEGEKGPRTQNWQHRSYTRADFENKNVGLLLGPKSGEVVDADLDCPEALALADLYLPQTRAEFGRRSKPRSHRLYEAPGAVFDAFRDPLGKQKPTLLEFRAPGPSGSAHQTLIPPSVADGEQREWHGDVIEPAAIDARVLRRRCAWLAI